jgi:NitT/TauT family transport system substrate-binding protein
VPDELIVINIACFPNITHAQALLLKNQGTLEQIFGETGIDVNWLTFNAGPSQIEALFAGAVDIGYIGPVPALSGYIQSGGDLQIIAGASNGGSVLLARNDSEINTARDLDGRTVAIPQFGNTQHLSLLALLSANGLSPTTHGGTVSIVQSSNADIANLMNRASIDAALVPEPWGSILELNHDIRVVLDYDKVDSNGIPSTAVVIVRKDFLDAFPEAVAVFIEAHKEATLYINDYKDEAMVAINNQIAEITHIPIDSDVLESAFRRLQVSYEIHISSILDFAQVGVDEHLLPRMPDENLTNDSFIR